MYQAPKQRQLCALLAWYRDVGVYDAVAEQATDWLSRGDTAPGQEFELRPAALSDNTIERAARHSTPRPPMAAGLERSPEPGLTPVHTRQVPAPPPEEGDMVAGPGPSSARTLDELRGMLEQFEGCALKATAKNLCFHRGSLRARVMLIGEAPGRDEDLAGRPFVGRAGQLLDRMLAAIGLDESLVHITNIVYWRPPGNRTPTLHEAQVCRPFLERQMELVRPDILILLGGVAAKHVLDVAEGIMRVRGKWRDVQVGGRSTNAIATLHPAYLLRSPAAKRLAWRDLLAVRSALQNDLG
jgi:uracil-DNA glycosylase